MDFGLEWIFAKKMPKIGEAKNYPLHGGQAGPALMLQFPKNLC
jgi:hypothetical protein